MHTEIFIHSQYSSLYCAVDIREKYIHIFICLPIYTYVLCSCITLPYFREHCNFFLLELVYFAKHSALLSSCKQWTVAICRFSLFFNGNICFDKVDIPLFCNHCNFYGHRLLVYDCCHGLCWSLSHIQSPIHMDIFPEVGYLNHMVDQFPLAKALSILISIVAGQGSLLTKMEQVYPSPSF